MKSNLQNNKRVDEILANQDFSKENLEFVVLGYCNGTVDQEFMSKFLLWIYKNGLTEKQTVDLTTVMLEQGEMIDMSDVQNSVDKHSTGGVSDSTTLIVVPLFALLGFCSLKMSGGALGHTGGTADKMKVFEGINISLDSAQAKKIAKKHGGCFCCQTSTLAPIDKKLYALRDKIGAVMSIPLIASSIMSKKLSLGAKNIVLDVKFGDGALICDQNQSVVLAKLMQSIGESHGRNTKFVLGDMNQPLGNAIGDYYEVMEVCWLLSHFEDNDLIKHSVELVCALCDVVGLTKEECRQKCYDFLKDGKAFDKLQEIITAQGGKIPKLVDIKTLPCWCVLSNQSGTVKGIKTRQLGTLFHNYKNNGACITKRIGQKVEKGECLAKVFGNFDENLKTQLESLWEIE